MSGNKGTTQSATSEPWKPAQPYLQGTMQEASNLQKAGIGGQVNTMSNVVPFANQTTAGMNNIQGLANQGMANNPFTGALNMYQNTIANGGMSPQQTEAMGYLKPYASGQMAGMNSPAFQSVVQQGQNAISDRVNESASGMGRYGSGAHQQLLSREIGDFTNRALAGQMNADQDRQLQAISGLFSGGNQGIQNAMAAGQYLPGAYDAQFNPARASMGIGSMYEDLARRTLDDRNRIFDETQNRPWENLARANAIFSGGGSLGGSTSGYSQGPSPSPLVSGIGGALSGYSAFQPYGLGGVGGLAGGLLGLL